MENSKSSVLNGISGIAVCPICGQSYTRVLKVPIIMQCGHTFCKACLETFGRANSDIRCTKCNARAWQTTWQMKKNYQLFDLLEAADIIREDPIPIDGGRASADPRGNGMASGSQLDNTMNEAREVFELLERLCLEMNGTIQRIERIINQHPGSREIDKLIVSIFEPFIGLSDLLLNLLYNLDRPENATSSAALVSPGNMLDELGPQSRINQIRRIYRVQPRDQSRSSVIDSIRQSLIRRQLAIINRLRIRRNRYLNAQQNRPVRLVEMQQIQPTLLAIGPARHSENSSNNTTESNSNTSSDSDLDTAIENNDD